MRNKLRLFATFALALTHTLFSPEITHAQGTAFTYQGQLQSGSAPATGLYDLSFALHGTSDPSSPQIGSTVTSLGVGVTNGIFTTMLDFGPVFNGNPVWLSIAVRTNGGGAFTALTPLQSITPSPYAVYAPTAGSVTGPISLTQLPASVLTNGGSNVTLSGVFSGNGTLLSNVTATGLTINPLATNYGTSIPLGTNSWSSNGIYTFTIPAGVLQMTAKLWGGGGSASYSTRGGGGAFSQVTLSVTPGQTYVLVVGQSGGAGGGAGANDASGSVGNTTGGQGSSLFYFDGFNYFTRAVAGGGGGGGGGYGANAGQASGAGNGYATSALTTGVTNLNQIGGNGAPPLDGGNGGGYGGGVSAGDQQANGGGSYGSITYSGAYEIPGNTSDPNYLPGAGFGGALPHGSGADGLGVVLFYGHGPVATLAEGIQAQQFIGDGSLLTNLTATFLTTNAALFSKTPYVGVLTNFYTTAGLQTFTVPAGITNMVAQLWGAGGGNAVFDITVGGGGAFAQVNLNVSPGDTYALVVGQSGGAGGGAGANNASGGAAGANTGSGGQGTSLFKFTGTNYILVALAGGGGGGGILYDGGPGQASGSGSGYSTNALTTGETSLNLFGGDGTAGGINAGGGGGGGYGGGMGGADIFQVATGGGSYGTITFSGNGTAAANTSDLSYVAPNGNSGQDGLAAISFIGHSPGVFLPDTVLPSPSVATARSCAI